MINSKVQAFVPGELVNIEKDTIGIIVEGSIYIKTHSGTDITKSVLL
jgi:hypothetical protein